MKETKKSFNNYLCSVLIGGMLLSVGNIAFAGEIDKQNVQIEKVCNHHQKGTHKKNWSPERAKERIQKKLSILVKNGTLSQDKADKVTNSYYVLAKNRKVKFSEVKTMNPKERSEYFKKIKQEKKDLLNKLVKDGVITSEEAQNIEKALSHRNHHSKKQ